MPKSGAFCRESQIENGLRQVAAVRNGIFGRGGIIASATGGWLESGLFVKPSGSSVGFPHFQKHGLAASVARPDQQSVEKLAANSAALNGRVNHDVFEFAFRTKMAGDEKTKQNLVLGTFNAGTLGDEHDSLTAIAGA